MKLFLKTLAFWGACLPQHVLSQDMLNIEPIVCSGIPQAALTIDSCTALVVVEATWIGSGSRDLYSTADGGSGTETFEGTLESPGTYGIYIEHCPPTTGHYQLVLRLRIGAVETAATLPADVNLALLTNDDCVVPDYVALNIDDATTSSTTQAWPNPFDNMLTVRSTPGATLRVTSIDSRIMHVEKVHGAEAILWINSWPPGTYLLQTLSETGMLTTTRLVRR